MPSFRSGTRYKISLDYRSGYGRTRMRIRLDNKFKGGRGLPKYLQPSRDVVFMKNQHWVSLFESAPDYIVIIDSDKRIVYTNKTIRGLNKQNVEGKDWLSFNNPEYHEEINSKLDTVFRDGVIEEYLAEGYAGDGKTSWYSVRLAPLQEGNRVSQIVAISRDISELKETESKLERNTRELSKRIQEVHQKNELINQQNQQLSASEDEMKKLYTQLQVRNNAINQMAILSTTDHEGNLVEVNDKFCELTKFNREEVLGRSHKILNSGYHPESFFIKMWETILKGEVWRGELKNKAKDGSYFWLLKTIIPFKPDESSDKLCYFSLSSEITEQKERELELAQAKKEAEDAMRVKEEFLSIMSHEIRTPLNSVIGLSELLLNKSPRKDQLKIMETLNISADNLMRLINDILDFSKIQAQKVEINKHIFSLYDILNEIYITHKELARDKGLSLKLFISADVPHTVNSDDTRLRQILNNLVMNAIKFTKQGHVTIQADMLDEESEASWVRFSVKDTGIGIDSGDQELIFEAFEQTEYTIRQVGGTGLGLAIVKNLVKLFGGVISVESELGQGSVFHVDIPLEVIQESDEEADYEHQAQYSQAFLKGHTVLYVEDVYTNQFLVQNFLENLSIECDVASSGKEALELLKEKCYDMILMDVQMPNMDGFETTQRIRRLPNKKHKKVPIIAFTADTSDHARKRIMLAGMDDYITKPMDSRRLLEILNRYLAVADKAEHPTGNFIDLVYFKRAFGNDHAKVDEFVSILKQDLLLFEQNLTQAFVKDDYDALRQEIHKVEPIIAHLKCTSLLDLFARYRSFDRVVPVMAEMNQELKSVLETLQANLLSD